MPEPRRFGGAEFEAEAAGHPELNVGLGGVLALGYCDPRSAVEVQAGGRVGNDQVAHVQVGRAVAHPPQSARGPTGGRLVTAQNSIENSTEFPSPAVFSLAWPRDATRRRPRYAVITADNPARRYGAGLPGVTQWRPRRAAEVGRDAARVRCWLPRLPVQDAGTARLA